MARDGIAKVTVEGVAREAGVARATIYRTFPGGRDELVAAAVSWEVGDFFAGLALEIGPVDDVATLLERGLVAGRRRLGRARRAPARPGGRGRPGRAPSWRR